MKLNGHLRASSTGKVHKILTESSQSENSPYIKQVHRSNKLLVQHKIAKLPFALLKTGRTRWTCPKNPNSEALKSVGEIPNLLPLIRHTNPSPKPEKSDIEALLDSQNFVRKYKQRETILNTEISEDTEKETDCPLFEKEDSPKKCSPKKIHATQSSKLFKIKRSLKKSCNEDILQQLYKYQTIKMQRPSQRTHSMEGDNYMQYTFRALKSTASFAGKIMEQIRKQSKINKYFKL